MVQGRPVKQRAGAELRRGGVEVFHIVAGQDSHLLIAGDGVGPGAIEALRDLAVWWLFTNHVLLVLLEECQPAPS